MQSPELADVRCDDCGTEWKENDIKVLLPDIPHLFERIEPGEEVPFGECPDCGALVHLIR